MTICIFVNVDFTCIILEIGAWEGKAVCTFCLMFQIQVQDNGKHSSVKSRPNLDLNTLVQMKATMVFPFLLIGEIMCFWFHSWGLCTYINSHNASKPILYFMSSGKSNEIFSIVFLKIVKSYHRYIFRYRRNHFLVKYICKLISTTKNTLKLNTARKISRDTVNSKQVFLQ